MEQIELQASPRAVTGKQVKQLRAEGIVPGILYGHGIDPIALKFNERDIEQLVTTASSSSLVSVNVEGHNDPYTAIIRDLQRDVIKRNVTHIDLQALSMKEKVRLPISINLVGTAPAVEELGGILLQQLTEVEVECLPTALVSSIDVDITGMTEIGTSLTVEDLVIPEGIEILTDTKEMVVQITAMAEEIEEEEELEAAPELEVTEVEVITKGKEEEEEGEEA